MLRETLVDSDSDRNLPEFEGLCINVFESDLILLLDGLPEGGYRRVRTH